MSLNALFSSYTQSTRLLRLTTPLGANTLLAESVHGEEGLRTGFRFVITALSLDAHLSLRDLIGQPALLELLTADNRCRPFHGHLATVEQSGANGGLARYTLTLEPWTAFLARNRDSRVFQYKTVREILDAVFNGWRAQGKLTPSWRYDLVDAYPQRSLSTQYQESDWAFAERLMDEAGLFYWFEHTRERHQLVIADHNGAFKPNRQASVRFTQSGAVMREDSIDRWRCTARLLTNAVQLSSWDYRTHSSRQVATSLYPATPEMICRDAPGQYAYPDQEQGQRAAERQLDAIGTRRTTFTGAGTVRSCAPGTTFTLDGHPVHDDTFLVTRVVHAMRNNLDAEVQARIAECLGPVEDASIYRNRIEAIAATVRYRAGALLHSRPTVRGQQTAIVVGPKDAVVHTDRDHRVTVQMHWQREIGNQKSHSRLPHPVQDDHSGAPANDSAGTWVRVATSLAPIAGSNWGAVGVPRVGQEVLLDFVEGNIDRPVIIGALYNSIGKPDAPHSKGNYGAGAATGNAPAWFPGAREGNAHAAVLSGFKSQAMATSQWGSGAYSQLVFDDTAGQARISLQRHAVAHQGTDELNLGYLRHQCDNQRLQTVGLGAELKTENSLAVRAGQGLLLASERQAQAQMDARAAHAQVETSRELQESLTRTAQEHKAGIKNKDGSAEPAPVDLPAIAQMQHSAGVLDAVDKDVAAWSEPMLQLSSPAGIVATTPVNAVFTAGATTSLGAGQTINLVAQGSSGHAVKAGISLFTYGKGVDKNGLAMHAASGKVSSQSHSGATRVTADKAVTVASTNKSVSVAAKTHVLMTAQGGALKIEGGNITLSCPGQIDFKATAKELAGPVSVPTVEIANKIHELNIKRDLQIKYVDADGNYLTDEPIDFGFSGTKKTVVLDSDGKATIKDAPLGPFIAHQPRRK
ncbi:type VI secretion system Vgr family protein [Massilia sp. S19_KUP03_FR1]|uniref:type VI secretion system Vgr family protein n=1 Tax=Massilia sp. S19_KUP03_FR1 TaxID=3025503 RepID=UPI002FCD9A43